MYKRLCSALVLSAVVLLFTACSGLLQPTCADFARASNASWTLPQEARVEFTIQHGNIQFNYQSLFYLNGSDVERIGNASVTYGTLSFLQGCHSVRLDGQEYQQFQEEWVPVESASPLNSLSAFLADTEKKGQYEKRPIGADLISDDTAGIDTELYRITLRNENVDWTAFCDARVDSFLGGNPFTFDTADVQLYFGAANHILSLVLFSAENEMGSLNGAVLIRPTGEKELVIDESRITHSEEAVNKLPEAWSLYAPETGRPCTLTPHSETLQTLREEWEGGNRYAFALRDSVLNFPCTVQDLLDLGLTADLSPNKIIEAGAQDCVHFQYHSSTVTALYRNSTEDPAPLSDCNLTSIALFLDDLPDISVALPGSLSLNTSVAEIEECWGKSDSDDHTYTFGSMEIRLYVLDDMVYGAEVTAK